MGDRLLNPSRGDSSSTPPMGDLRSKFEELADNPDFFQRVSCPGPDQNSILDFHFGYGYGNVEAVALPPLFHEAPSPERLGNCVVENFVPEAFRNIAMGDVFGRKFYEVIFVRLAGVEGSDHDIYAVLLPGRDEETEELSDPPVVIGVSEGGYESGSKKVAERMKEEINFKVYGLIRNSMRDALMNRIPRTRFSLRRNVRNWIDEYEGRVLTLEEFRDPNSIGARVTELVDDLTNSMREEGLYNALLGKGVDMSEVQSEVYGSTMKKLSLESPLDSEKCLLRKLVFPLELREIELLVSRMRQAVQEELRGVGQSKEAISASSIYTRIMRGLRDYEGEQVPLEEDYAIFMTRFMRDLL